MSTMTVGHAGPWTEEGYLALGETTGERIELVDGSLVVSAAPASDHQQLDRRLANLLEDAAPDEFEVIHEVNLRVGPGRILIPDLVVTTRGGEVTMFHPGDILLVAEVVSPSTASMDRVLKSHLYATAGIRWYLQVEPMTPEPPVLRLYELAGSTYTEHAHAGPGETLALPEPLSGSLEPATLLKRRR
ncbi:MAG: Uma2 family endonuclease [Streptosporangiales bacterium]|nr:Uma2 family endonuclease [Streptosporangiales bacterium]